MNNRPLVSVIITTYNRKERVFDCIASVLDQTYGNLEIIVVDDCSSDGTPEVFADYHHPKVRYVRHEINQGVQYASNTGFRYAKGKYLAFVGDDDVWNDRNKLEEQARVFEEDREERYGVVTTSVRVIRKNETFDRIIQPPRNIVKHLLARNGIIYGSAALLRREAFTAAGQFVEELPKGTDSDVFRRLVLLGYDVFFIPRAMVDYHEDNTDRMTGVSRRAITRSIIGETYKLRRYHDYYEVYPTSRAAVLASLASWYRRLYMLTANRHYLTLARSFALRSLRYDLLKWRYYALTARMLLS